ncbi:MerR family DNA-binding transcriptional regulator [bacterium]|nr:MerR family DNA-binding transcriptional regulator [bacterium]
MTQKTYRTSDLARAVGIHPNTVMRYIDWGLIPPVERTPAGYRIYTQHHLDCLRLARLVYSSYYPGKALRTSATGMIESAVADDWADALEQGRKHLANVETEIERAESTVTLLENWANRTVHQGDNQRSQSLTIGQACEKLDVTHDVLRNWERNGLIRIPRDPANGYRRIGEAELERLRIIRLLSQAGYSMMAMLRMFIQFDRGELNNLGQVLDTPNPDEDVYMAADRWLTVLNIQKDHSIKIKCFIEEIIQQRAQQSL